MGCLKLKMDGVDTEFKREVNLFQFDKVKRFFNKNEKITGLGLIGRSGVNNPTTCLETIICQDSRFNFIYNIERDLVEYSYIKKQTRKINNMHSVNLTVKQFFELSECFKHKQFNFANLDYFGGQAREDFKAWELSFKKRLWARRALIFVTMHQWGAYGIKGTVRRLIRLAVQNGYNCKITLHPYQYKDKMFIVGLEITKKGR